MLTYSNVFILVYETNIVPPRFLLSIIFATVCGCIGMKMGSTANDNKMKYFL